MSEDKEAQEDELLALASIYDEEEFHRAQSAQGGEIRFCLELPPDFKVVVKGTAVRRARRATKAQLPRKSIAVGSFHILPLVCIGEDFHRDILSCFY